MEILMILYLRQMILEDQDQDLLQNKYEQKIELEVE
jgi:hypothetical protein